MESNNSEIITLQLGNYANYVGSHFWNLMKLNIDNKFCESESTIFMRESLTYNYRQTKITPRLISFDLKGSLMMQTTAQTKTLVKSVENHDYGFETMDMTNTNNPTTEINESSLNSENNHHEVNTWYDYFTCPSDHPLAHHEIKEYCHASINSPFDNYDQGDAISQMKNYLDDIDESIRVFAEECNQLQGFQLFVDASTGFSGFSSGVLKFLCDDYLSKGKFTFPFYQPNICELLASSLSSSTNDLSSTKTTSQLNQELFLQNYNWIRMMSDYHELASLTLPMSARLNNNNNNDTTTDSSSVTHFNNNPTPFESSAILSLALENILLPIYCNSDSNLPHQTLWSIKQLLCPTDSVKLALVDYRLPLPLTSDLSLANFLLSSSTTFPTLNPFDQLNNETNNSCLGLYSIIRGVKPQQIVFANEKELAFHLRNYSNVDSVLELFLRERNSSSKCTAFSYEKMNFHKPKYFPKSIEQQLSSTASLSSSCVCVSTDLPRTYHGLKKPLDVLKERGFKAMLPVMLPDQEWDEVHQVMNQYENMMERYL